MKTRTFITALALLFCSTTLFAGNCLDSLSASIARIPNAEKVNLNSFVLGLIKPFSSEMKGIKSMNILNAEDISQADYDRLKKQIAGCNDNSYETLVASNEDDEIVRILMKTEKGKIKEIIIFSLEKDEVSLLRIKGKIDPQQLNEIIENDK
ncbi:DUF4252 domain-containing protein [Barnesiella sp. An55]|uniref:DUF4252 domain-containing protein n=1 Tax=Barnesiella sp. An55 TaxID=1965646 RepID=UPI000B390538|nr:DUF4252 domain-containing protein [Barnesiella sp. An55]OUN74703.1 hypothetical protein B5G10_00300 [Barnesiella sp. An55]